MNNRLYVENLPPSVNEGSVRELFSKMGMVTEVKLVMDASTGLSRGRAFVTMATPEIAQTALKTLHSHSLGGRIIAVTEARPTEERPAGLIGHGFEAGMGETHVSKAKENGQKQSRQRYRPRHKRNKVTNHARSHR